MPRLLAFLLLSLFFLPVQAWYNGDWMYRHKITLLNSQINGDQTNFPVYLNLQDLPGQFFNFVDANGADIRMTANDGVTEIPYELVNLDQSTRRGELWFKAPTISSTSNLDFFIYYGNANGTAYNDFDDFGANSVWVNGYKLVSHLNEDPSNPIKDSTVISNSILSNGSMTALNSIRLDKIENLISFDGIDDQLDINRKSKFIREVQPKRAYNFDGTNDYLQTTITPVGNGDFSFSFWIRKNSVSGSEFMLGAIGDGGLNDWELFMAGDGSFRSRLDTFNFSGAAGYDDDEWHHVAFTADRDDVMKIYVDGNLENTEDISGDTRFLNQSTLYVGRRNVGNYSNMQMFDLRIFNGELSHNQIKAIYNFQNTTNQPWLWYKMDDTHATIAFDASGNNNHATKSILSAAAFHYEGKDVPFSFQNSVGYGREGYAENGEHINIDPFSEVSGGWFGAGTTTPTVGFGSFFGKNAKWVTYTAASNTGYLGTRATTTTAFTGVIGQIYSWSAQVRASRNLAPGENITVYYTGASGFGSVTLGSTDDLTSDWLYIEREGSRINNPGVEYLTTFLSGSVGSDITFYIAENQMVEGRSTINDITYAPTYGRPTGTLIPKDESKTNPRDINNGSLLFKGAAPNYAIYNGSFAGEFDGVDDLLSINHNSSMSVGNGSYSVSFLTRLLDTSTDVLALKGTSFSGLRSYYLYAAGGNWSLSIGDGANSELITVPDQGSNWHRVTMVVDRDRDDLIGYVDGVLEANADISIVGPTKNTSNITMGQYPGGTLAYNGQIADFRVFNKKLSQAEIRELNNVDFDLTENTIFALPFSEGQGTTLHDVSGNNNDGILTNADNGDLFWTGSRQDIFHYNAKKGFTKFLATSSSYPSGITYTGHGFPNENLKEVEVDFLHKSSSQSTLVNFQGLYPFRFYVNAGLLYIQRRRPDNSFPFLNLGVSIATNQYYSLRMTVDRQAQTVKVRDLLNGSLLANATALDFHPSLGANFYIGRYDNSSTGQGSIYVKRVRFSSNGTVLSEWTADSDFRDTVGSVDPTSFSDSAHIIYMPALLNGNGLADTAINGQSIENPGGVFNNKAESDSYVPKSKFDIANGDILNIQKIFRTNDTGTETLLKKGDDAHGYELRINNGVLEFEAMNQNGSFSVTAGSGLNDDQEHIVHILFDPASEIELFVDGQELNSTSISSPEEFINAYSVMLANPNNGSGFFSGESDELRFSNHSMDPSWIQSEYENIFNTTQFYLIDNGVPNSSNTMFWGGQ